MKTGKRILSVLLAVLMLALTASVAFAAEDEEPQPLYVIYKLPAFDTWDLETLDAYYTDDVPYEIYPIVKEAVFNDEDVDSQTGMVIRYDNYDYEPDMDYYDPVNYQAFFVPNSRVVSFHQYFEYDYEYLKLWHFASGKIDNSFFYVLADYNSPFVITVEDVNGTCCHEFEIKGLQYSSCKAETAGSYYCSICKQSLSIKFPACHLYGEDILRTKSSCTEGCVYTHYCARCNASENETGKPYGHCYLDGDSAYECQRTVAASCFTDGYDEEICQLCGQIQMTNIQKATGKHVDKDKDNHCDVCGTLINKPAPEPTTQPADEKPAENNAPKKNFFQRIIDWFKNLFSKLFK